MDWHELWMSEQTWVDPCVVVLEGAKAQMFQITSETKITKDDKPATLSDAKVGEPVTGYAVEIADGKWEARSLYAGKHTPVKD
jgi:hypothetical protein